MLDSAQLAISNLLAQEALAESSHWIPVQREPSPAPWEVVANLEAQHIFVLLLLSIVGVTFVAIALITTVAGTIKALRMGSQRSRLIQQLLDRGYSPADIRGLIELTEAQSETFQAKASCSHESPPMTAFSDIPPAKPVMSRSFERA